MESRRPAALLATLCVAMFMVSLDLFIVNVGLPEIGRDVGNGSLADLSWIINAYAIVFAALLVPAGRLADRYGHARTFLAGLVLFTLGNLGAAVASDLWVIVALRVLTAVGAAALLPSSLGLILTEMPADRRESSVRLWAVVGSLGAAAGPALGGILVELSWRWVFLLNVPVGLVALVAAWVLAPRVVSSAETRVPDLAGGVLLIVAVGSLALALVKGGDWGWGDSATVASFAIAALGLALFTGRSARHPAPVVRLDLFRSRRFAWASATNLVLGIPFAASLLALTLWLQQGWDWSPLEAGLGIAPGPMFVSVTALGLRRFTVSLPDGAVIAAGALLIGAGGVMIGVSLTPDDDYLTQVLPGWLVVGAGVGFSLPTIVAAGTADLPPEQSSTGSAIVQMARQLGLVLGVALIVIVVGPSTDLQSFTDAWWWAGAFSVLAAATALLISPRATYGLRVAERTSSAT